jgi:hemolysin activation/secretion protein
MRLVRGLASALYLASATNVYAQAVPDPVVREAQRLEDRANQKQAEREEQFRNDQQTPPSGEEITTPEAQTADNGQCVAIREIAVKGLTRYTEKDFSESLAGLVGDCVSIGAINNALRAITNRYVSDGYVTSRAVVGPQDLKAGILEIIIIEGSISEIRSSEDGYSSSSLSMAFPGQKGKQLNLRAMEQGVDQLARLGSYEPNIDIEPGALPGTSNLLITRKKAGRMIRPAITFDNDGSAATGRFQATTDVEADNIFGLADYWSIYYSRDLKNDPSIGNESMGGSVSIPYGWWTASLTGGRFSYKSILAGNGQAFSNDGKSWNGSLSVDRMIFRDAKTKLSLVGGLALLDTENRIQGIRLSTSSYRQVTGTINLRAQRRLKNAVLGLDLGFAKGLKILGANAADTGLGGSSITASRVTTAINFQTKAKLIGVPLDYSIVLRGQAAVDPVFSNGRFSLGGKSTVRGFRDDGISGRYGAFMRHQVGFPLMTLFQDKGALKTGFSGFVGYDAGLIIPYNDDRFERGQLHSSTIGLRMANRHMQVELTASTPIKSPSFLQNNKPVEVAATIRLAL